MKYTAKVFGTLNGKALQLNGAGELRVDDGLVVGSYEIAQIASGVDSLIFNCVLVTGYPSACKATGELDNPFKLGSYQYERQIRFGGGGAIRYRAECDLDPVRDTLSSSFYVDGVVVPAALVSSLPIVETWTPATGNRVLGEFTVAWRRQDGGHLRAIATTDYLLPDGASLSGPRRRQIILKNEKPSVHSLFVRQESELFRA